MFENSNPSVNPVGFLLFSPPEFGKWQIFLSLCSYFCQNLIVPVKIRYLCTQCNLIKMTEELNIIKENAKRYPRFQNFGEMLFWSYANLQMLFVARKEGKVKYDRICYMIRAKAFKAYKEGRWQIHDLFELNIEKIKSNNYCWYCGKEKPPSELTKDHVFPRIKGGKDSLDNIIMVCRTCNSSKGKMDLFEWYEEVR